MKKFLRKFAVLIFAVALIAMPSATVFAASNAVVDYDADGFTSISFQPDPLFLAGSSVYVLEDITEASKDWIVPAGKTMYFSYFTQEQNTTARIVIFGKNSLVYDNVITSTIHGYQINMSPSTDEEYTILILPYTNVTLTGYAAYIG
ncbi:MAG: hypothetical protein QM644_00670 [Mobilitalea sp.]